MLQHTATTVSKHTATTQLQLCNIQPPRNYSFATPSHHATTALQHPTTTQLQLYNIQPPRNYSFTTSNHHAITALQHQLLYKDVEESMGPNEVDCPMPIMNQLEGHPPLGEYSAS